jgi:hypothetical protein
VFREAQAGCAGDVDLHGGVVLKMLDFVRHTVTISERSSVADAGGFHGEICDDDDSIMATDSRELGEE